MKNILLAFTLLLLFVSFSSSNDSAELKWLDWNTGYPLAKKQNKKAMHSTHTMLHNAV